MTGLIKKYGKIALALAAIFLSGQLIGWMLALHSCDARPAVESDPDRWSDQMMTRLAGELGLSDAQAPAVRAQLEAVADRLEQKRDSAMFQIHLEMIKLHDDLESGLSPDQKKKLAQSRRRLVESTQKKFPQLLHDTVVPPSVLQPAQSPTP